jgi:hypothetical protein
MFESSSSYYPGLFIVLLRCACEGTQGRTQDFARGDAHFWLTYPLPPPRIRLRIRIKTMRIHSPGLNSFLLYFCIT